MQYYISWRFFNLGRQANFSEWQVIALAILFACIASGNLITTLLTVIRKASAKKRAMSAAKEAQKSD